MEVIQGSGGIKDQVIEVNQNGFELKMDESDNRLFAMVVSQRYILTRRKNRML